MNISQTIMSSVELSQQQQYSLALDGYRAQVVGELDDMCEYLQNYTGQQDDKVASFVTHLLLHQKAHMRLMNTLLADLKSGKNFKIYKKKNKKAKAKKEKMIDVTPEDEPMVVVAATQAAEPVVYVDDEQDENAPYKPDF